MPEDTFPERRIFGQFVREQALDPRLQMRTRKSLQPVIDVSLGRWVGEGSVKSKTFTETVEGGTATVAADDGETWEVLGVGVNRVNAVVAASRTHDLRTVRLLNPGGIESTPTTPDLHFGGPTTTSGQTTNWQYVVSPIAAAVTPNNGVSTFGIPPGLRINNVGGTDLERWPNEEVSLSLDIAANDGGDTLEAVLHYRRVA